MRDAAGLIVAAALLSTFGFPHAAEQHPRLLVFAAASTKNALDQVAAAFRERTGRYVAVSYGASSTLARQIQQGAPADVFLSADTDWMDFLGSRNLLQEGSRRNLLGNRIVLVAPASTARDLELKPGSLREALGNGRLAVANVATVPAGKYAKAALEHLGLWSEVVGRLAEAENVRAALAFVARGEAPLGIVYETDARSEVNVAIVARFPTMSHPPIVYPVAIIGTARTADAAAFLQSLLTRESTEIFAREGFAVLD